MTNDDHDDDTDIVEKLVCMVIGIGFTLLISGLFWFAVWYVGSWIVS